MLIIVTEQTKTLFKKKRMMEKISANRALDYISKFDRKKVSGSN